MIVALSSLSFFLLNFFLVKSDEDKGITEPHSEASSGAEH